MANYGYGINRYGMLGESWSPTPQDIQQEQQSQTADDEKLAAMGPFQAAAAAGYGAGRQIGQGAGEALGALTGTDVRSPGQIQTQAIKAAKAQISKLGYDANDPKAMEQFYPRVIQALLQQGLVPEAMEVHREMRADQSAVTADTKANKLTWRDRMEEKYSEIAAQLEKDPENAQLLKAQQNLQQMLGMNPKPTKQWQIYQPTQFSPGYKLDATTGETQPLGGTMGAGPNSALTGDDYLATLSPADRALVQAMYEGRKALPSAGNRSPLAQRALLMLGQAYPGYDETVLKQRSTTASKFAAGGTEATSANALNTAMGHLGDMLNAVNNLDNSDFPAYNFIANKAGEWGGNKDLQAKIGAFRANAAPLAMEITRAYRGAGGAEADIQEFLKSLSTSAAPSEIKAALQKFASLFGSKIDSLQNQYDTGMAGVGQKRQMLTPHAQDVYNSLLGLPKVDRPAAAPAPKQPIVVPIPASPETAPATTSNAGVRWKLVDGKLVRE